MADIRVALVSGLSPLGGEAVGPRTYTTPDVDADFVPKFAIGRICGTSSSFGTPALYNAYGIGQTDGVRQFFGLNRKLNTNGTPRRVRSDTTFLESSLPNSLTGRPSQAAFQSFQLDSGRASITLDWFQIQVGSFESPFVIELWGGDDLVVQTDVVGCGSSDNFLVVANVGFPADHVFGNSSGAGGNDVSAFYTQSFGWALNIPTGVTSYATMGTTDNASGFYGTIDGPNNWIGQMSSGTNAFFWQTDNLASNASGFQFLTDGSAGNDVLDYTAIQTGDSQMAHGTFTPLSVPGTQQIRGLGFDPRYVCIQAMTNPALSTSGAGGNNVMGEIIATANQTMSISAGGQHNGLQEEHSSVAQDAGWALTGSFGASTDPRTIAWAGGPVVMQPDGFDLPYSQAVAAGGVIWVWAALEDPDAAPPALGYETHTLV